jgi:hypothetical protein
MESAQEYKTKVEDLLETLPDDENQNVETAWENIVTYSGFYSRWNFIALQKSIHYS